MICVRIDVRAINHVRCIIRGANESWRRDYASDHVGVLIMANMLELKGTVYSAIGHRRATVHDAYGSNNHILSSRKVSHRLLYATSRDERVEF